MILRALSSAPFLPLKPFYRRDARSILLATFRPIRDRAAQAGFEGSFARRFGVVLLFGGIKHLFGHLPCRLPLIYTEQPPNRIIADKKRTLDKFSNISYLSFLTRNEFLGPIPTSFQQ